jgi:putative two-component system response regulator
MPDETASIAARVLIVDDEIRNVKLLDSLLRPEGYEIRHATSGEETLHLVARDKFDLILLDVMMPGMDGFAVAGKLKSDPVTKTIPIIMVTSLDDRASRIAALNMGAEEFLTKPVDRAELWVRVRNLLRLKRYNDLLENHSRVLEQQVQERSAKLTASYRDTIATLNRVSAFRDEETGNHVSRISHYCVELARALGMPDAFVDCIEYASPMHDVGKVAIPDAILQKPGPLTADEWVVMRTHAALGARMLEGADSPYLVMGREIALCHHERFDGSGYPAGLAGEAIPLSARIMNVADVYDALRSRRPYKTSFDHATALRILAKGDGRTLPCHFDPPVLAAFLRAERRMCEIFDALGD